LIFDLGFGSRRLFNVLGGFGLLKCIWHFNSLVQRVLSFVPGAAIEGCLVFEELGGAVLKVF
jgi:hypothetical protein